jgi:hypothetical protein
MTIYNEHIKFEIGVDYMSTTPATKTVVCAAKIGSYFNERGKFKNSEPMYSRDHLRPGDEIMVYDYEQNKHVKAIITSSIMPEVIEFEQKGNHMIGSYSAKAAMQNVENTELPHVYLA